MQNIAKEAFLRSANDGQQHYLIIDTLLLAEKGEFYKLLSKIKYTLLYADTRLSNYLDISPIVVAINSASNLLNWFLRDSNTSTGIVAVSYLSLKEFSAHFKSFIFYKRYDDTYMLLRIYDPYVMQYLEDTFNQRERSQFFSNISEVIYLGNDRLLHRKTFKETVHG